MGEPIDKEENYHLRHNAVLFYLLGRYLKEDHVALLGFSNAIYREC
jgi:hypothetical protein